MLRLVQLRLQNFGPYKGDQVIDFPHDDGVTIVYGENMRGKTSLLNAIRYALFGKLLGRGSNLIPLHQTGNWEAAADGRFGFKVILAFEHDGHQYELTRICAPRPGVSKPESDADYAEEALLRKDKNVLGPGERDDELARIMPEQVSRFFLFDGELLQQYEELLRNESEMGQQIAQAIERILGIPILTNARRDLRELHKAAQKQESKAAQKDLQTRELGNHLADLTEQRAHQEKELARLEAAVAQAREKKAALEGAMRKSERLGALLSERDRLAKENGELDEKIAAKRDRLKEVLANSWHGMLSAKLNEHRRAVATKTQELEARAKDATIAATLLDQKTVALKERVCPVCRQDVSSEAGAALVAEVGAPNAADQAILDQDELLELRKEMAILAGLDPRDDTDLIRELIVTMEDAVVERATKLDRIAEIEDQIKGVDQSTFYAQKSEYEALIRDITILEGGIKPQRQKGLEIDESIAEIEKRLRKVGGVEMEKERQRSDLYGKLHSLFSDAVAEYRERLRKRVEADATSLFVKLTSEPDYKGLAINESYGLSIMHKDGHEIPLRSAGAEHVVALSLMGALQKNAPLRGPIIMDSPLQRLDDTHTRNVVKALPHMAQQVALLVYESELKPQFARELLLGKLRAEYHMIRRSARHTEIEKGIGSAA